MGFKVPITVIEKASKCPADHSCLTSEKCGDRDMCEIAYADGTNVLFLVTHESAQCPYRTSFAGSQICCCPVHFAIYNKYNK